MVHIQSGRGYRHVIHSLRLHFESDVQSTPHLGGHAPFKKWLISSKRVGAA